MATSFQTATDVEALRQLAQHNQVPDDLTIRSADDGDIWDEDGNLRVIPPNDALVNNDDSFYWGEDALGGTDRVLDFNRSGDVLKFEGTTADQTDGGLTEALHQLAQQLDQRNQVSDSIDGDRMDSIVITDDGRVWSNNVLLDGIDVEQWRSGIGVPEDRGIHIPIRPIEHTDISNRPIEESRLGGVGDDRLLPGSSSDRFYGNDVDFDPLRDGRCDPFRTYGEGEGCDTIDYGDIDQDRLNEMGLGDGRWLLSGGGQDQEDLFGGGTSPFLANQSEAETLRQLIHQNTASFI